MTKEKAKKLSELLKAYSEGKTIQLDVYGKWSDIKFNKGYIDNYINATPDKYDLRIKPELKLVPFTFEDKELFKDKWIGIDKDIALYKIVRINSDGVLFATSNSNQFVSYGELCRDYEFEDGSDCGKYVNE